MSAKWAARIGAGSHALWGIFHLAAANSVYVLAEQTTGMVRGRLLQNELRVSASPTEHPTDASISLQIESLESQWASPSSSRSQL
jgi:hypothetical protein